MEEFKNLYIYKPIQISNTLLGNAISEKIWDLHSPLSHPIFNTLLPSVEAKNDLLLRVNSLRSSKNKQELLSHEKIKRLLSEPRLKLFLKEIILTDLVRELDVPSIRKQALCSN